MNERASDFNADDRCEPPGTDHLLASARLEALGRMARGVAHDFANLLMVIAGHAELSLEQLDGEAPLRNSLVQIQNAAQQANELCRELSAYAGRTPLTLEPTDLSGELARITDGLRRSLPTGVRLATELSPHLPPVEANASRLEQLVGQLVSNAADAVGQRQGTIHVRTDRMSADRAWLDTAVLGDRLEPGEYVYLEVADGGEGMDRATAERMFDPFFTTRRKGQGLGLARVLGIVRSHGGAMHVTTAPEQGTTIRVLFPRGAALSDGAREALRKLLEG